MRDYNETSYNLLNLNYSLPYFIVLQKKLDYKTFMLNFYVSRLGIINGGIFMVGFNYKNNLQQRNCSSNIMNEGISDNNWNFYIL